MAANRQHRGFPCPLCGKPSEVITSRMYLSKVDILANFRHRLRLCDSGHRFKTREIIDKGYPRKQYQQVRKTPKKSSPRQM